METYLDRNGISLWDVWLHGSEIQLQLRGQAIEEAQDLRSELNNQK